VYDLAVRTLLIDTHDAKAHALHMMSARRVRAQAQADVALWLYPQLTEREQAIFRRGRNAKLHTVPKHASLDDYRAATALEAVLGYLYLSSQEQRLLEVLGLAAERLAQTVSDAAEQKPYKG
jgi:ribonuclease-3 family protein